MELEPAVSVTVARDMKTLAIRFASGSPESMASVTATLSGLGVRCEPAEQKGEGWEVRFGVPEHLDLSVVLGGIKELFKPRFAVSFSFFSLKIRACRQNVHQRDAQTHHLYLPGFEPESEEVGKELLERIFSVLKEVKLGDFIAPANNDALQMEHTRTLVQIVAKAIRQAGAAGSFIDVDFQFCCSAN